jgi:hypothetical protein
VHTININSQSQYSVARSVPMLVMYLICVVYTVWLFDLCSIYRLVFFYPQASDVGETQGLVPGTVPISHEDRNGLPQSRAGPTVAQFCCNDDGQSIPHA